MKVVQKAIKSYIKEHGIKIDHLAQKCDWSTSKLSAVLNGFQPINSADYGTICEALGVEYNLFYFRTKGISRL